MALPYRRNEVKDWAMEHMQGACNVTMPSFTSDLKRLNPAAIRHDLRRSAELGFWGTLIASECGTTMDEMKEFIALAAAEKPKDLHLVLHGSFNTVQDTIEMSRFAEQHDFSLLLLSYPLSFFPQSSDDIYQYHKAVSEGSNLAILLFAIGFWDFARLHPSGYPMDALVRSADLDTVAALKYECGQPGTGGMTQIQKLLGKKLLITDPIEHNAPAWVDAYGMQFMGTSYYNYFGDRIPKQLALMRAGKWDEAMEIFWANQPAREAYFALRGTISGGAMVHRMAWKYMDWLNGFSGGPVRMPHMRLSHKQMASLRAGAVKSGLDVTTDSDEQFFIGRNPA